MRIGYVVASDMVAKERKPVGYLYREEPSNEGDSGWRVFSGEETQDYVDDPGHFAMYNASTILEIDPSIRELLASPVPAAFERDAEGVFVEVDPE